MSTTCKIKTTRYYDEFIRYYELALDQQKKSNLGHIPHAESKMDDPLMEHIELYDVVERKYAGFSQIVNDAFYGQYLHSDLMRASKATFERCKRLLQLRNIEMVIYLAKDDLDSFDK